MRVFTLVLFGLASASSAAQTAVQPPVIVSLPQGHEAQVPPAGLVQPPNTPAEPRPAVPVTNVLRRPTKDETCLPRKIPFASEIHAGGGSDRVWSGDQPSRLFGDAEDDFVAGGPGNDEIHGGTGADILMGGAGSDLFVIDGVDDSPTDENGDWSPLSGDTVVDFTNRDFDKFDLRLLRLFGAAAPPHFRWSGHQPAAYGVWVKPRAGDTVLLLDVDGNSVADIGIRLIGTITLGASDFCGILQSQ